jgi:hypothetical protein
MRRKITGTEALVELVSGGEVYHSGQQYPFKEDFPFLREVLTWTDCEVDDPTFVEPDKVVEVLLSGKSVLEIYPVMPNHRPYQFKIDRSLLARTPPDGKWEYCGPESESEVFSSKGRTDGFEYRIVEDK